MTEFKKFRQDTREGNRQNESIQELFQGLNLDMLKGAYLTEVNSEGVETQNISLTTTAKTLVHKLGRDYIGFLVIERNASAIIRNTRTDVGFITLTASANVTAKIWVF